MAVTDANLMVGKLLPDFFPHVFGPSADRPLDAEVVRAAFAALAHEVARSTGIERSPEELAHGCLAIANDNMANAIKEISVQRGIDVTHYALCCFGGAGSQHACQVADLLGIGRVFIHPYASVLSAYGMGLADVRVLRQQAIERPLDEAVTAELEAAVTALGTEARAELRTQDVPDDRIAIEARVHVRYTGTDTSLEVPIADAAALRAAFEAEHRSRYGFIVEGRGLVVEAITVEGIGTMEEVVEPEAVPEDRAAPLEPVLTTPIFTTRAPHQPAERVEAAVFTREACCRAIGLPVRR